MKYITEINKTGNIAVDDNILVKGALCSAGSHILDGFTPLFGAEAVDRLEKNGYTVSGKTNIGEFGLDLVGETSYYGAETENGKLKNAAASLVKEGAVDGALSVDLNGAPRRAAAQEGITFIKPTYSSVSRYGVIACACSSEQIGVSAKTAKKAMEILGVIAGHDPKDGTSDKSNSYSYSCDTNITDKKACVIKELVDDASEDVKKNISSYIEKLKATGISVTEVSLGIIPQAQTAWQILMSAETCNNLSKFDGVKYGYRTPEFKNIDDIYTGTRTEGFGFLAKATILYGSDVLAKGKYESCYDKSMRVRRVVADSVSALLGEYDLILSPCASTADFSEYDLKDSFKKVFDESKFTVLATLTGNPAIVTDGVQLMAKAFNESLLFSVADKTEEVK